MKRLIRLSIPMFLLVTVLMSSVIVAHASEITPRYVNYTGILVLTSGVDVSTTGKATGEGSVKLRDGYTADLVVELKQDGNTIKTWTDSGSGRVCTGGIYYVASGHEYTVTTTATVYDEDGNFVESVSKTSPVKDY